MSYYRRLKKDLSECVKEGIITQEKLEEIYSSIISKKRNFPELYTIIIIIGGILISLGIILIISHNWHKIPDLTKIILYLLIFLLVGFLSIKYRNKKYISIPSEILWFFMPAIGMGLYGQIFQISSDPIKPYILWAIIIMPMVWFLEKKYIIYLFETLVYGLIIYNLISKDLFYESSYILHQTKLFSTTSFRNILIYYSFLYFIYLFYKKTIKQKIPERIFFFSFLIVFIFLRDYIVNIFSILGISFAIFLFARKQNLFYTINLIFWLYYFSFGGYKLYPHISYYSFYNKNYYIENLIMTIIISGILYSYSIIKFFKSKLHLFYPTILLFVFSLFCMSLDKYPKTDFPKFLINMISLWFLIAILNEGIKTRNKAIVNLSIYSIAIFIITRFFDLFGESLLQSGISFTIAGIFLIVIAYVLNIIKKDLTKDL